MIIIVYVQYVHIDILYTYTYIRIYVSYLPLEAGCEQGNK